MGYMVLALKKFYETEKGDIIFSCQDVRVYIVYAVKYDFSIKKIQTSHH